METHADSFRNGGNPQGYSLIRQVRTPPRQSSGNSSSKAQNAKRNKLLHRFYEVLVLLYILDRTQGGHIPRLGSEESLSHDLSPQELRRRFLDSLSYVCDYEKGGDTTTAIFVSSAPLTYHVACNKNPKSMTKEFLQPLLTSLGEIYDLNLQDLRKREGKILRKCVDFSYKRVREYLDLLRKSLSICHEKSPDGLLLQELLDLEKNLNIDDVDTTQLCLYCDSVRKSSKMDQIKRKASVGEQHGNFQSPYADVKHFIGRLAYHVKAVKTLVLAAQRLPTLFQDPKITPVACPVALVPPPDLRNKSTLPGIVNRMLSGNEPLRKALEDRLEVLNRQHDIETNFRKEYVEKNFKPRVHAELILVEYFYSRLESIEFEDQDPYIGCSKPACYCCDLYIRAHAYPFIEPATHQKIYLNWIPPTSTPDVRDLYSDSAKHEQKLLNKMLEDIRARTIEQIMNQTGRRRSHFDTVTSETNSGLYHGARDPIPSLPEEDDLPSDTGGDEIGSFNPSITEPSRRHSEGDDTIDAAVQRLDLNSDPSISSADLDADSDTGGGVPLL